MKNLDRKVKGVEKIIDLTRVRRLARDLVIKPVGELPEPVLKEIYPDGKIPDGYYAIQREKVRAFPKIVNQDVVDVLRAFGETGASYSDVLKHFVKARNLLRHELDPNLRKVVGALIHSSFLVDAGDRRSSSADSVQPSFNEGDGWQGYSIRENLHCIVDSEIYKVVDPRTGEARVLKIMQKKFPNREMKDRITRRLKHEFSVMQAVRHPNVVKLFKQGTYRGRTYGILELADGQSVAGYAHDDGFRATDRKLMNLALQCVEALKSVHDAGYLHGDVHAGNFLIRDGRVCLIDFGLTRPVRIAKKEESKYEEGGVVLYMPPEYVRRVFNGRKGFWGSVAGEIYSCAVILYFLFTKRMPYTWKYYREEYMKCILNQPPLSFEENGRTPWSELEVVLQRALAKRKKDRFASMGHFLKTLKKVHLPDAADENPFLEEVTDTQAEREGDR